MANQKQEAVTIPFRQKHNAFRSQQESSEGWSKEQVCQFYGQQVSLLANQVRDLQNHVIGEQIESGMSSLEDLPVEGSLRRTQLLRQQLEHIRRMIDLSESLGRSGHSKEFDLVQMIRMAWDNCATGDSELEIDAKRCRIYADPDQVYLAIAVLIAERVAVKSRVNVSLYAAKNRLEMEIADNSDFLDPNSLGINTAKFVTQSHGGKLTTLQCPQGGIAFNFVFPSTALQRAA